LGLEVGGEEGAVAVGEALPFLNRVHVMQHF
jgi:hypothetical protein